MTEANLRSAVERVLGEVDYPGRDHLLEYVMAVRKQLVEVLPENAGAEVYHRHRDLVVEARCGAAISRMVIELP